MENALPDKYEIGKIEDRKYALNLLKEILTTKLERRNVIDSPEGISSYVYNYILAYGVRDIDQFIRIVEECKYLNETKTNVKIPLFETS